MRIVPVIMSGGAGSRLWPLSRAIHPKPFVRLPDGETLARKTYERAAAIAEVEEIVTVTNKELLFLAADEYAEVDNHGVRKSFLLEPMGRDTALAVALAALYVVAQHDENAIIAVMPADHLIGDKSEFAQTIAKGAKLAESGLIATFGILPTRPDTGFGYIEAEGESVLRFVEKPDAATAADYLASGRFYWNSGMLCFKAGVMLEALKRYCPEIYGGARKCLDQAKASENHVYKVLEFEQAAFERVPAISIDYAVMEKADNIAIVPCGFEWSDIGSWNAMSALVEADCDDNRLHGDVMTENASSNFVLASDRLVSLVGVRDLLVVDTSDALLVTHADSAQNVKTIYNRLLEQNREEATTPCTVSRPWGSYTVLEQGAGYKIKRIVVKPGGRLSLQSHRYRSEHWVVIAGAATVTNGDDVLKLMVNQSTYIPQGNVHRLENEGAEPLAIIEVQSGDYLGEDDIERYEDTYGRR